MVEISRDGRRVYFTNSLYGAIDPQFYPDGIDGWMVKLDAKPDGRHRLRPEVLRGVAGAAPPAPGAARGRRLLIRSAHAVTCAVSVGLVLRASQP